MNDGTSRAKDGAADGPKVDKEAAVRPWHHRHRGKLLALGFVLACALHTVYVFRGYVRHSLTEDSATGAITRMIHQ